MRQRAVIAMALSCNPALLVADEPTTALDVTVQAQILDLVRKLQRDHKSAVVFITHDMGVVAEIADRVMVMYAGRVVERGSQAELFSDPRHPYTRALLDSIPPLTGEKPRRLRAIPGSPPSLLDLPQGCCFRAALPGSALSHGAAARTLARAPMRPPASGWRRHERPMSEHSRHSRDAFVGKSFTIGTRFSARGQANRSCR